MPRGAQLRLEVPQEIREEAVKRVMGNLTRRLVQHGDAAYAGSHEALGTITEEYFEFVGAVQSNDPVEIMKEASDIAVAAIWTVATMLAKKSRSEIT